MPRFDLPSDPSPWRPTTPSPPRAPVRTLWDPLPCEVPDANWHPAAPTPTQPAPRAAPLQAARPSQPAPHGTPLAGDRGLTLALIRAAASEGKRHIDMGDEKHVADIASLLDQLEKTR